MTPTCPRSRSSLQCAVCRRVLIQTLTGQRARCPDTSLAHPLSRRNASFKEASERASGPGGRDRGGGRSIPRAQRPPSRSTSLVDTSRCAFQPVRASMLPRTRARLYHPHITSRTSNMHQRACTRAQQRSHVCSCLRALIRHPVLLLRRRLRVEFVASGAHPGGF